MDAQLKKGLLEVIVLAAIRREESYGYKIISDISPYIEISESTLYPILRRLEQNGSVITRQKEFNGRVRKYFRITDAGNARIADFKKDIQEFNRVYEFIVREDRKK